MASSSSFPIVCLVSTPAYTLFTQANHIHVHPVDDSSSPPFSTRSSPSPHSGIIRLLAISRDNQWVVSTGDDKLLKVWNITGGNIDLASTREVLKKSSTLTLTSKNEIILGDKFGDVFSFPLHPTTPSGKEHDKFAMHADPSLNPNALLILGHTSHLTALELTPDESLIITADRDERVRVSWFPQGWNIVKMVLGHQKFISSLHFIPSTTTSTEPTGHLISGGADPALYVWSFPSGNLSHTIPIEDLISPHIVHRAQRRHGRGKGGMEERVCLSYGGCVMGLAEAGESGVVFFSLGAKALFYIPSLVAGTTPRLLDLGHPITDIAVLATDKNVVLVSLDLTLSDPSLDSTDGKTTPTQIVAVSVDGDSLSLLPSMPISIPVILPSSTPEDSSLRSQTQIYQMLSEYPKFSGADGDENASGDEGGGPDNLDEDSGAVGEVKGLPRTGKRDEGRKKRRANVKALAKEQDKSETVVIGDGVVTLAKESPPAQRLKLDQNAAKSVDKNSTCSS